MKYLAKDPNSIIIKKELTYKYGNTKNNKEISKLLLNEQKGFCAYTEVKLSNVITSKDIEHFNSELKYTPKDNYYNYYLVTHGVNKEKEKKKHLDCQSLFDNLFFQNKENLWSRITYNREFNTFLPIDESDNEASVLIELICVNDIELVTKRTYLMKTINLLSFQNNKELVTHFEENLSQLVFPTALQFYFNLEKEIDELTSLI